MPSVVGDFDFGDLSQICRHSNTCSIVQQPSVSALRDEPKIMLLLLILYTGFVNKPIAVQLGYSLQRTFEALNPPPQTQQVCTRRHQIKSSNHHRLQLL